ncbi:MAG: hypothetical protein BWY67_01523 [Bacteroidetes bacterium ADurb.Bin397]|nr:MAG: hypothetical protein BWY67_01523 [Bacteroidetes bacterium ADurb.Bin397]
MVSVVKFLQLFLPAINNQNNITILKILKFVDSLTKILCLNIILSDKSRTSGIPSSGNQMVNCIAKSFFLLTDFQMFTP